MSTVPKYIKQKARRAEKLAREASCLVYEIEEWIEQKGIDYHTLKEEYIIDEVGGCDHLIDVDALEEYLT